MLLFQTLYDVYDPKVFTLPFDKFPDEEKIYVDVDIIEYVNIVLWLFKCLKTWTKYFVIWCKDTFFGDYCLSLLYFIFAYEELFWSILNVKFRCWVLNIFCCWPRATEDRTIPLFFKIQYMYIISSHSNGFCIGPSYTVAVWVHKVSGLSIIMPTLWRKIRPIRLAVERKRN